MSADRRKRGGDVARIERFISPEPFSGCWLWTANAHPRGYGLFWFNGKMTWAHRATYEMFKGPIPRGLEIDHICRNHSCVNPSHLEVVTHAENMRRSHPNNLTKTHCPAGHPYDTENTYLVDRVRNGQNKHERHCKECSRIKGREWQRLRRLKMPVKSAEEIAANRARAAHDPIRNAKLSATLKRIRNTPEAKLKLAEQARRRGKPEQMHTPEAVAKRISGIREYWKSDEAKKQQSERLRGAWSPELRERQRQHLLARWAKIKADKQS